MLNETLRNLANDLNNHQIDYAVIGAIALSQHGYQRFTVDIGLLMTKEGLEKFHQELIGRGYRPAFDGARKKYRTTDKNIPVEIITTGEYPEDGEVKPISFPDQKDASVLIGGVNILTLEMLISLKLASGMTNPGRLKDLADVQELIRIKGLDTAFADRLHACVRGKFLELCQGVVASRNLTESEL